MPNYGDRRHEIGEKRLVNLVLKVMASASESRLYSDSSLMRMTGPVLALSSFVSRSETSAQMISS